MKAVSGKGQAKGDTREPRGQRVAWAPQCRQCERCEGADGAISAPAASVRNQDGMGSPRGDGTKDELGELGNRRQERTWLSRDVHFWVLTWSSFLIDCLPPQTLIPKG